MTRKFSQRSLNNLAGVHPDLVRVVTDTLQTSPIDFVVIEGVRSRAKQQEYYNAGKSRTMNSRHLHGLAVDLWPIDPLTKGSAVSGEGAPSKELKKSRDARLHELFDLLGAAMKASAKRASIPITWGGDWTTFVDKPHFELPPGLYPDNVKFEKLPVQQTPPSPTPVQLPEPITNNYLFAKPGAYRVIIDANGVQFVPE